MSARPGFWARRKARRALVQAIYQWQMTDADTAQIEREFAESGALAKADDVFFRDVLRFVVLRTDELDALLVPHLDRELAALDKVELALLRMGAFELSQRPEIPFKVVIDECVELAKSFGGEDGHKYVNGVLDRVAAELRTIERDAASE